MLLYWLHLVFLFQSNAPHDVFFFFFFNDPATTEIYPLPLHDALPICSLAVALAAALVLPASIRAQAAPSLRREIAGFDFRKDGVWRRQARSVRAQRARLLAGRSFGALNAAVAAAGGGALSPRAPLARAAAVSGVLRVPAVLFKFKDTPGAELRDTAQYDDVLFAPSPTGASAGRPYTYASWYAQLSNGLLSIQGASYGYVALDSNEVSYTGTAGTCSGRPLNSTHCNRPFSNSAFTRMQSGPRLAPAKNDAPGRSGEDTSEHPSPCNH